jgi:hypothetical protein
MLVEGSGGDLFHVLGRTKLGNAPSLILAHDLDRAVEREGILIVYLRGDIVYKLLFFAFNVFCAECTFLHLRICEHVAEKV